ncbi:unnamed protein product [Chrysoparadoxa australica]
MQEERPSKTAVRVLIGPLVTAFMYYMPFSMMILILPKVVNDRVGGGEVTSASSTTLGVLAALGSFCTICTTNLHATLSDSLGRKPFMFLGAMGFSIVMLIIRLSEAVWPLYVAIVVEGCLSCMYSVLHASVADVQPEGNKLSEAYGLLQGAGLGMGLVIGLPLSGILADMQGIMLPVVVAMGLSFANALQIVLFVPETLAPSNRVSPINWSKANPVGALKLVRAEMVMSRLVVSYMLLWAAQASLSSTFINLGEKKYGWSTTQTGAGLAVIGILVAILPKILLPRLGLLKAFQTALACTSVAHLLFALPAASGSWLSNVFAYCGLALAAVGGVSFPSLLALASGQVSDSERGAVQGAADTAKTVMLMIFSPAMAALFGYFISSAAPIEIIGFNYYIGSALALAAFVVSLGLPPTIAHGCEKTDNVEDGQERRKTEYISGEFDENGERSERRLSRV